MQAFDTEVNLYLNVFYMLVMNHTFNAPSLTGFHLEK